LETAVLQKSLRRTRCNQNENETKRSLSCSTTQLFYARR
jgi:hypothetical protein